MTSRSGEGRPRQAGATEHGVHGTSDRGGRFIDGLPVTQVHVEAGLDRKRGGSDIDGGHVSAYVDQDLGGGGAHAAAAPVTTTRRPA
jgi:hypothetical protein